MNWSTRMANVIRNMNKNNNRRKERGKSSLPRSKSSGASSQSRPLKSQSTSAMDGMIHSLHKLNISGPPSAVSSGARSAVRIPVRSTCSGNHLQTLDDLNRFIQMNRVRNVVVMAGAGISTPSGIPDFRTPGTGLYDNLRQYKVPYPEAIFDIDYFHYNPRPFFTLAKDLYPDGTYQPNPVHHFCRLLHDKGMLLRMYTQNIDGLERIAGIPPSKLVEAHGTFATATCVNCRRKYEGDVIKHEILSGKLPLCRSTLSCSGIIKPDIVFFGEDLPKKFWYYLKDFPQADMLIVMGTSLAVEPFAGIIDYVRFPVPRVLFNLKAVGPFKRRRRMNDVTVKGDLVENICLFMKTLGWEKDYSTLTSSPLPENSPNQSETESESSDSSAKTRDTSKTDVYQSLRRNETPLFGARNGHKTETKLPETVKTLPKSVRNGSVSNPLDSSPNRRLSASAHNNRLLAKRGSLNSGQKPVVTRQKPSQTISEAQYRVNRYKETLEKLRRWQMDSTSSSESDSSESD